jgi:SAM-dependent methyltransferase
MSKLDLQWDTVEGEHFVANEDRYTRMLAGLGERLIEAAEIQPSDSVLDVGCGYGAVSLLAARAAEGGRVLGLDISPAMLQRARERASERGVENVTFQEGNAQTYALSPASFDAVISRLGVMFFEDPGEAFANFLSAVRPGGRLAMACWKDVGENEHMMVPIRVAVENIPMSELGDPNALSPFSLADPDHVRDLLEGAGWTDVHLEPVEESMWWGTDAEDVTQFIAGAGRTKVVLSRVDEATALRAADALRDALREHETTDGVLLGGAAWVVTAKRPQPTSG